MATWQSVQHWLNSRFRNSKEIGDAAKELGLGLTSIGLPLSLATATPAPLAVGLVVAGAGQAVKGLSTILAGLTDPGTDQEERSFQHWSNAMYEANFFVANTFVIAEVNVVFP